jgi:hypothetical protein
MKKFMDDPAVRAAFDQLHAALTAVAGREVKNLLIIGLIPDQPGSGMAEVSILYKGCDCPDCAKAVLTAASRPFGMMADVEISEAKPTGVTAAREVH